MAKICALVVLLAVAPLVFGGSIPSADWKIVGGDDAPEGAYPHQISLRRYGSHSCGGAIINKEWILTAAHCVIGAAPSSLTVAAGSNKLSQPGPIYNVELTIVHENYNSRLIQNDVALVKLATPIEFTDLIQPIELETEQVEGGEEVVLSGWGRTSYPGSLPDKLQWIKLKSISHEQCSSAHAGVNPVVVTQLCTLTKKDEGACHGDSGSALIRESSKKQVGIVSWGIPCARARPDVFTRVSSFIDWIKEKIDS